MTSTTAHLETRVLAGFPLAMASGFAATIAFTLVAYYVGIALAGFPLDIGAALAGMVGDNAMLGTMAHYLAGSVAFPLGFVIVARRVIPGPWWVKGAGWGVVLWLAAMIVVAPMLGAGLFLLGAGGIGAPAASLIAHLVYGVTLAGGLRAA